MIPQRPANVPDTATYVYPGQMFGPGLGEQFLFLARLFAIIAKENADDALNYANALRDYLTNAPIYASLGIQNPRPAPVKPTARVVKIQYVDNGGNEVDPVTGADGLHGAWTWEQQ